MSQKRATGQHVSALLACALVLTLVVVVAFLSPAPGFQGDRRPSSYFTADSGGKAAFLVLNQLFPAVQRWNQSFRLLEYGFDSELESILVMGPTRPLTPTEVAALERWIVNGGQLIVVADTPWPVQEKPERLAILKKPGEGPHDPPGEPEDFLKDHGFEFVPLGEGDGTARLGSRFALKPGDFTVLIESAAGTVAAFKEIGEGQLVVVADSLTFSNSRLKDLPSNLTWLARQIGEWGSSRVDFDEYHLDLGERRPLVSVMASFGATPWGLACLQVGLASLLYLVGTRRRFGKIEDPEPEPARDPMTLMESRAGLLRTARARRLVVQLIDRHRKRGQSRRFTAAIEGEGCGPLEREYQDILQRSSRQTLGPSETDLLRLARLAGEIVRRPQ